MTHSRKTLAAFTFARRKHLGFSPARLARKLKLTAANIHACEAGRRVGKRALAALLKFNELEGV